MTEVLNNRQLRDAIEAQLKALAWDERSYFINDRDYTVVAGVIRKALAPQLAEYAETQATLERVRAVVGQHRYAQTIPRWQIEAALHGDEEYLNAR